MGERSIRRITAHAAPALLAGTLLVGCGGDKTTIPAPEGAAATVAQVIAAPSPTTGPEYNAPCPTAGNTMRFAKTRFALHAGLALGAFHRYVYKPLRGGGFEAGAEKRKRAFVKAAVAGAFALHQLKVAKGFAVGNPTLCKAVEAASDRFTSLADKLKGGTATNADVEAGKASMDGLQRDATNTGYPFKEQNVTIPGAA
ncbi:hypothetical protein IMZ11_38595 [Microtetraspora sp. AC03309]|uniref:hypothetical protein n=1 Tax=Microtetraspora sp. AC03309 TaxID=2779376 RepID=UPI001E36A45A|nr:hypothetical protein [Microtetraspora sp. AC03309]MCC5581529.1 hypothetical protein [Microtetraspora sp. AC03309]